MTDDDLPDDWQERLDRFLSRAADDFRACSTAGELAWLQACDRYFENGMREDQDHGALIDYLGISYPSVLDRAGYSPAQALRVMELLSLLEIDADGICRAPKTLPPLSSPSISPVQLDLLPSDDSNHAV